jgi:alkylation response protein AidB-like acyl-CoA dehydrogenase
VIFPSSRTDEQLAIAESAAAFCADFRRRSGDQSPVLAYSPELWAGLAALGILAHGDPEQEGSTADLVVAADALGAGGVVAPLPEAFAGARLLPPALRHRLARGELVVALAGDGDGPFRWAPVAELMITFVADGTAWLARAGTVEPSAGHPEPVSWGRAKLELLEPLGPGALAIATALATFAALLCGLAGQMVRDTADYVRERRQFGKRIGSFQAVGHPLAECQARVHAARDLAMSIALRIDLARGAQELSSVRASAELGLRAASRTAMRTTYACQQALGAMGYVVEGPMGILAMVMRELCVGEVVHTFTEAKVAP